MVEHIKVGNKKLPVRVSYRVLKKISALSEEKLEGYARLEQFLFFSLQAGHKAEGIKFDMTEEDVEDILDDNPAILGEFTDIMEKQIAVLTESMGKKTELSQEAVRTLDGGTTLKNTDSKTSA